MMVTSPSLSWIELCRNSSLSATDTRKLQDRRFRRVVRHAYQWVPFYRQHLKGAGVTPRDIQSVEDLGKIPILHRKDLQSIDPAGRLDQRVDDRGCIRRSTGGSTGRPLISFVEPQELTYETLGWLRTWKHLGLNLRDHQVTVKHPEDLMVKRSGKWYQRLGLLRISYVDLRDPAPRLIERLAELQPQVLRAQPSVLMSLAREMPAHSANSSVRPRLVFCTGERLSRNAADFLRETFHAEVHNCYGATEAGCIGWWCPVCERFHVNSDYLLVEVIKDGRPALPGEVGEVVITNLYRTTMPVIRFSLGDLAELAPPEACAQSNERLRLTRIVGRSVDSFQLADGSEVSPYNFMPDEMHGVLIYQVVQERPGEIRILLVPGRGFEEERLAAARQEYERELDGRVSISFEVVDELPSDPDRRRKPALVRRIG